MSKKTKYKAKTTQEVTNLEFCDALCLVVAEHIYDLRGWIRFSTQSDDYNHGMAAALGSILDLLSGKDIEESDLE